MAGNMAGRPCGLYAVWSLKEKLSMLTLYCSQCFNSLVGEMVKICWLVFDVGAVDWLTTVKLDVNELSCHRN
jgi:hypothetical protein